MTNTEVTQICSYFHLRKKTRNKGYEIHRLTGNKPAMKLQTLICSSFRQGTLQKIPEDVSETMLKQSCLLPGFESKM